MAEKRPALGKGLSALIPDVPEPSQPTELDIDLLTPNRFQPRANADEARLDELAQSIKANGIIQPIVVRRRNGAYEIIAGERRWRAAQRAGLLRVPVVFRDVGPNEERKVLEMALIENLQREDLNPIEEASAYQRLADEFGHKHDEIAAAVGKDRSSVANYIRLLKLPEEVRASVAAGSLSMGHARALLAIADTRAQLQMSREIISRGLSVRETEAQVKKLAAPAAPKRSTPVTDVHTRSAEEQLRITLGTRVRIVRKGSAGRIEIEFGSEDELHRLYEFLTDTRR